MNLPPSSLLGRLEAFLPEMKEANQATQKLAEEGTLEVLDGSLQVAPTQPEQEDQEEGGGTDNEEEEEEEGEGGGGGEEEEGGEMGEAPPRTVQLDFALGDFDDTPIAKMEQEKAEEANDAAAAGARESVGDGGDMEDEEDGEDSAIASFVRVPARGGDADTPRQKEKKPLIAEL